MKIINKSIDIACKLFPEEYNNDRSDKQNFHYAFIWKRNVLLSIGTNDYVNSHPKAFYLGKKFNLKKHKTYGKFHAETNAISKLWGKYQVNSELKMVVLRLGNQEGKLKLRNSKPCLDCRNIIVALGIRTWYSNYTENICCLE